MRLCLSSSVMMATVNKKNGTSVKVRESDPKPKTGMALLKEDCQISGTLKQYNTRNGCQYYIISNGIDKIMYVS